MPKGPTKLKHLMDLKVEDDEEGPKAAPLGVSKMRLLDGETKMAFVNKCEPNKILGFDLEAGKLYMAFDCHRTVYDIGNTKDGQMGSGQTLHGVEGQNMFTLDLRSGKVIAARPYRTNYCFAHIVSNS